MHQAIRSQPDTLEDINPENTLTLSTLSRLLVGLKEHGSVLGQLGFERSQLYAKRLVLVS